MVKDVLKVLLDSNLRLSKHFHLREFFDSTTAQIHNIPNCPPTYVKLACVLSNLQAVADKLELIRATIGGKPLYVTSGYRSIALNEKVGGNPLSKHCHGAAADITAKDFENLVESMEWLELKDIYWYADHDSKYVHMNLSRYKSPPPTNIPRAAREKLKEEQRVNSLNTNQFKK